jgi:hypothetical protein
MRLSIVLAIVVSASAAAASEPAGQMLVPTCPGRGYVAYSYPAFGSCPCEEDRCFHPGRYYSCSDAYEKSFWRRWRRAHFHGGSMLDDVPCHCIDPSGRPVAVRYEPLPEAHKPVGPTEDSSSARLEGADLGEGTKTP